MKEETTLSTKKFAIFLSVTIMAITGTLVVCIFWLGPAGEKAHAAEQRTYVETNRTRPLRYNPDNPLERQLAGAINFNRRQRGITVNPYDEPITIGLRIRKDKIIAWHTSILDGYGLDIIDNLPPEGSDRTVWVTEIAAPQLIKDLFDEPANRPRKMDLPPF